MHSGCQSLISHIICKYFLPFYRVFFSPYFLMSFNALKFLILMKLNLLYLLLLPVLSGFISMKSLPNLMS